MMPPSTFTCPGCCWLTHEVNHNNRDMMSEVIMAVYVNNYFLSGDLAGVGSTVDAAR